MLNDEQLLRYSRQIMLPNFDVAGQERLLNSRALIIGLGGLGCPVALYLAAAGVGTLLLADGDRVELSNLQRQVAHAQSRLDMNKAQSAAEAVAANNPETVLEVVPSHLDEAALADHIGKVDLVVDASDSFATRFAVNRVCWQAGVPVVSGAAIRSEGQVAVFDPRCGGPCYRCLYRDEQGGDETLSCAESGVLAPVVGVIGCLQALEAIKILAQFGEPISGHMLVVDAWSLLVQRLTLKPDSNCPVCSASSA